LLSDLKGLDWPEGILAMQRNWIGRKEGINIKYQILNIKYQIECFTTRPDTNFGATFIVLAPEHPFVKEILDPKSEIRNKSKISNTKIEEIKKYVEESLSKQK
jgi:leucyl-tRNA synthetase